MCAELFRSMAFVKTSFVSRIFVRGKEIVLLMFKQHY